MTIQIDDIETKVYTDEKWVRFIVNQIIGNAIKYHAEQPILHFGATKTNDKIVLSISDNGIGIPKSDLPRIFEKGCTAVSYTHLDVYKRQDCGYPKGLPPMVLPPLKVLTYGCHF